MIWNNRFPTDSDYDKFSRKEMGGEHENRWIILFIVSHIGALFHWFVPDAKSTQLRESGPIAATTAGWLSGSGGTYPEIWTQAAGYLQKCFE